MPLSFNKIKKRSDFYAAFCFAILQSVILLGLLLGFEFASDGSLSGFLSDLGWGLGFLPLSLTATYGGYHFYRKVEETYRRHPDSVEDNSLEMKFEHLWWKTSTLWIVSELNVDKTSGRELLENLKLPHLIPQLIKPETKAEKRKNPLKKMRDRTALGKINEEKAPLLFSIPEQTYGSRTSEVVRLGLSPPLATPKSSLDKQPLMLEIYNKIHPFKPEYPSSLFDGLVHGSANFSLGIMAKVFNHINLMHFDEVSLRTVMGLCLLSFATFNAAQSYQFSLKPKAPTSDAILQCIISEIWRHRGEAGRLPDLKPREIHKTRELMAINRAQGCYMHAGKAHSHP